MRARNEPKRACDARVLELEALEARLEVRAHARRVLGQLLVPQNCKHGAACGCRNWAATSCTEVLHSVVKGVGDGARRNNRAEREAVADGLTERHNVGHDVLPREREAPEIIGPEAPEASLHLVGDAYAARRVHALVHGAQIAVG